MLLVERKIPRETTRWIFFAAAIALALDRGTKWFAQNRLPEDGISFAFGFIQFERYMNQAAALSISVPKVAILTLTNFILLLVLWYLVEAYRGGNMQRTLSLVLIFVGGASNVYDRVVYGGVIDFLALGYFPVLNIADLTILLGLFLLMKSLRDKKQA